MAAKMRGWVFQCDLNRRVMRYRLAAIYPFLGRHNFSVDGSSTKEGENDCTTRPYVRRSNSLASRPQSLYRGCC